MQTLQDARPVGEETLWLTFPGAGGRETRINAMPTRKSQSSLPPVHPGHGGEVEVRSSATEGRVLRVRLPRGPGVS